MEENQDNTEAEIENYIRLLKDKIFGLEDMFGGGDFDYNSGVIQGKFAEIMNSQ